MSAADIFEQPIAARFCVGIDLGTTNCAVAFVDTHSPMRGVEPFAIEQLVDRNTLERRTVLPSFVFQFPPEEIDSSPGIESESGVRFCVGVYARDRGTTQPQRLIASAKSWLAHGGVDRTAPLLPWHADADVAKMSPVAASARYLAHIRRRWDASHPDAPLADQDVVITLPASFDEVARELTVAAARDAGLPRIVLIEEPQAAFYAWLAEHQDDWQQTIAPEQSILICDIGGGTTDFTLIRVRGGEASTPGGDADASSGADLERRYGLHRVAVGPHLLLGGDNFDAALAAHVERSLGGEASTLSSRQLDRLRMSCRGAKEIMLSGDAPAEASIFVAGEGRRMLEAGRNVQLARDEVRRVLLDGFFPVVPLDAEAAAAPAGFQDFGLPYAADPRVSVHLANFLWEHRFAGRAADDPLRADGHAAARPDWVLFNGGITASPQIRGRIVDQIDRWFAGESGSRKLGELPSAAYDLAVSRGAAYFALVRRGEGIGGGKGVRIDSRLARSYYIAVADDPPRVLCAMPADAQTLQHYEFTATPLDVRVGVPVQFSVFYSSTRLADPAGTVLPLDPEAMQPLPPIQTVLRGPRRTTRTTAQGVLESELTELGTLQLYIRAAVAQEAEPSQRWKLEFDVRSTVQSDRPHHRVAADAAGLIGEAQTAAAAEVLRAAFDGETPPSAKELMRRLSEAAGVPRAQWPAGLLRELWRAAIELAPERRRSAEAEPRWLNLLGYFLRPGFGVAADDWRVGETWRAVHGRLKHRGSGVEAAVLWRRVAGGFTAGQQQTLLQENLSAATKLLAGNPGASVGYAAELLRLLASLELVSAADKLKLAAVLAAAAGRPRLKGLQAAAVWSLGRLAAREPLYGPLNCVLPAADAARVCEQLLAAGFDSAASCAAVAQAARMTGDRYRDLPENLRRRIADYLRAHGGSGRQAEAVERVVARDRDDAAELFGESLPLGLSLRG